MGLFHQLMRPKADSTANDFMADVLGSKTDAAYATATTTKSLMAYIKTIVTNSRKVDLATMGTVAAGSLAASIPRCCAKTDGEVLTGTDDLFVVSGGPVLAMIVGYVTVVFGGNTNLRLTHVTTVPSATVNLNTGAVACNSQAAGSLFYNVGATSVFTPVTNATIMDPVTVQMTEFLLNPGTVGCLGSAARTGTILWGMRYVPLTPQSLVVAAA
jgi:hypothetical protein